eukprot:4607525-Prymnesium_polylepis.1
MPSPGSVNVSGDVSGGSGARVSGRADVRGMVMRGMVMRGMVVHVTACREWMGGRGRGRDERKGWLYSSRVRARARVVTERADEAREQRQNQRRLVVGSEGEEREVDAPRGAEADDGRRENQRLEPRGERHVDGGESAQPEQQQQAPPDGAEDGRARRMREDGRVCDLHAQEDEHPVDGQHEHGRLGLRGRVGRGGGAKADEERHDGVERVQLFRLRQQRAHDLGPRIDATRPREQPAVAREVVRRRAPPVVLAAHRHAHAGRGELADLGVVCARIELDVGELHREGEADAWADAQAHEERLEALEDWVVVAVRRDIDPADVLRGCAHEQPAERSDGGAVEARRQRHAQHGERH